MIDITIADDFADAGVSVTVGCIEAALSVGPGSAALAAALDEAAAGRAVQLAETPMAEVPEIAAARRAYRAFGKDPTRYRVSIEALMRRINQGKGLTHINALVDVNNLVSLATGMSCGTFDADAIRPPVVFRKARPGETYEAIARGPMNLENLPLFADAAGPFGSPTSDSERTKVTDATARALMVVIAFEDCPAMAEHVGFAVAALEAHCAARDVATALLTNAAG